MIVKCTPSEISGTIKSISSKSDAHRLLICAALSKTETKIYCNVMSKDIAATICCLKAVGTDISVDGDVITVKPESFNKKAELDCNESGSTLRFLMPRLWKLSASSIPMKPAPMITTSVTPRSLIASVGGSWIFSTTLSF